jgi:hypothetical protein
MALYNQRPLMFNLREWQVEISFGYTASDENTWANWMVWIAAEVVDFCFGRYDDRWARWEMLSRKSQKWYECKPMSFAPLFYQDRAPEDGKHLPELLFACPWHSKLPTSRKQGHPARSTTSCLTSSPIKYSHGAAVLLPSENSTRRAQPRSPGYGSEFAPLSTRTCGMRPYLDVPDVPFRIELS